MGDVRKVVKNGRFLGWYVRFIDIDGKRKQRASHQETRGEAQRFLHAIEARVARGLVGIAEPEPAKVEISVEQLRTKFLAEYARPRIKDAAGYRAAASVELSRLPKAWLPLPAAAITQEHVAELRDKLGQPGAKAKGEAYAPNTINGTLRALSRLFTWARAKKLIEVDNPCKGVERHAAEQLLEYLDDPGQVARLLAEARARCWGPRATLPASLFPMVATAVYAGLRKGELFALRRQDIDIRTRRFDVMRACKHGGGFGLPKGGKPRHLRLPLELVPILDAWLAMCPDHEGLLFPVPVERWDRSAERLARLEVEAAGRGDAARDARKMLARLAAAHPQRWRVGRHDDDLHLHDLLVAACCRVSAAGRDWHMMRHTFASHFMMAGGELLSLMKIMGHATIEMTMIYAHLSPRHLADEMDRVTYAATPSPTAQIKNIT